MTKGELLKIIRLKCIDCCAGEAAEVKRCDRVKCELHPFRMAKDPYPHPGRAKQAAAALGGAQPRS